jgi:hypothetical protein
MNPELPLLLQTFPKQKIYVAANMLPNYLFYSYREPGGVAIVADGACSMETAVVERPRPVWTPIVAKPSQKLLF